MTARSDRPAVGTGVGEPLPDIFLSDLDGNLVNLGDLKGKRRLLFMWGSW